MAKVLSKGYFLLWCQPRCQGCVPYRRHPLRMGYLAGQQQDQAEGKAWEVPAVQVPSVNQGQSPHCALEGDCAGTMH